VGDGPPFTIDARDARDAPGTGSCQLEITQDGTCNALALQGTTITSTCSTAAAPVASGGTIEDGTYVLETSTYYGSCPVAMSNQSDPTTTFGLATRGRTSSSRNWIARPSGRRKLIESLPVRNV